MAFNNKVVIVTGASSGIGAAAAIQFSKESAKVAIVGRNQIKLASVALRCEENGNKPLTIIADLTTADGIKDTVDKTLSYYGKLDILVNNAGIASFESILSEDAMKTFNHVMAINLHAAVHLTNLTAPHLIKTKGNIVNISSVGSIAPLHPKNFAYNVSKAALDSFTKSVALELAPNHVRVNSINPGPVKTDMIDVFMPDKTLHKAFWNEIESKTKLGRVSEPDEIAHLILYLASEKANGITGSCYIIDNGMLL